jgi:hypothetical protein
LSKEINLIDSPSESEAERRTKQIISRREQGPSTATQTYSARFFDQQVAALGQPYDVTHIPIEVLEIMQRDPIIAFGLHFKRVPLMRARWHIKCEDARIASFIDNALREIYPRLVAQFYRSRSFGFSPVVKRFQKSMPDWTYIDTSISDAEIPVWDEGNIEAITWKTFTPLPCNPEYVNPMFNEKGEFSGIEFNSEPYTGLNALAIKSYPQDDGTEKIPVSHSLWFTNERDTVDGSLWGYPGTGYVYRYWWSYWYRWALYDRFFERKSDPPYIVYYPDGSESGDYLADGTDVGKSMQDIALGLGVSAKSGGAIALPSQTYTDAQDKPGSIKEWDIQELEVKGDMSHFVNSFEYLDVMKLRGLFIPEQALIEGSKGQSSRNVAAAHQDIMTQAQASDIDELDDIINRFIIPDLVKANFPETKLTAKKVTTGFTEADFDTMKEIIRTVGQQDPTMMNTVDVHEMLERIGVPTFTRKEMLAQEDKIAEEMKALGPEPVESESGEAAGVTETGLYYQPREVISLSEDSDFVENLPDMKCYSDTGIKAATRQLRKAWRLALEDVYNDFATYLKSVKLSDYSSDFSLAEIDPSETVENILADWEFSEEKTSDVNSITEQILKRVMGVSARIELAEIGSQENWEIDSESVAEYLEEKGLIFADILNETTKNQLRSFLSQQISEGKTSSEIAEQIPAHFKDFPSNRANKIARTEIRDAYNFSTLDAGEKAGVKVVQAKDAQLGPTDEYCENRNNQFYSIEKAFSESFNEHPSGTLEWKLIPNVTSISEATINASELEDNEIGFFDDKTETIYFSEEADDYEISQFKLMLGEMLVSESIFYY